jgi:hypothetical protein
VIRGGEMTMMLWWATLMTTLVLSVRLAIYTVRALAKITFYDHDVYIGFGWFLTN